MRRLALIALVGLLTWPRPGKALEVLRLPWIFSDAPEISADFNFSPAAKGKTHVDFTMGGRFAHFGLPKGAARAPELDFRCEFVSPGELIARGAVLQSHVSLGDVLSSSGRRFSANEFSASSPLVFKSEFQTDLEPGDYNIAVSIEDKELSISSQRTLHVIVPGMDGSGPRLSDLRFCVGVGETLDKHKKLVTILDPNPWRQVGGSSGWDLTVAYEPLGPPLPGKLMRRHSIWKLRGDTDNPLWEEVSAAPPKKESQSYLAEVDSKVIKGLQRGVYVFKVEMWSKSRPEKLIESSKTFEVLP